MKPSPTLRWTIGQGMVFIVMVAVVLALSRLPTGMLFTLAAGTIAIPLTLMLTLALVDVLFGIPCPACGHWGMKRLARRRSYYCCPQCGARFRRFFLGPWHDASGPENEAVYRGKSGARPWRGFAIPGDHDDTTTGALLHVHRRRQDDRRKPGQVEPLLDRWRSHLGSCVGVSTPRNPDDTTTGLLLESQRRRREGKGKDKGDPPRRAC